MIKEIITILNDSNELQALIGDNIYPYTTNYNGECIIYQIIPQSDDKVVNGVRVQISIITETLDKALSIEKIIKHLLLTIGDEPLTNNILQVVQNGGGSIYDYGRCKYHHYIFLDIIGRSDCK